jgi:hypothetical protein
MSEFRVNPRILPPVQSALFFRLYRAFRNAQLPASTAHAIAWAFALERDVDEADKADRARLGLQQWTKEHEGNRARVSAGSADPVGDRKTAGRPHMAQQHGRSEGTRRTG